MTPQERVIATIIAELRKQEPANGEFFYVDAANTAAVVIDATVDLEAIAEAVIQALV